MAKTLTKRRSAPAQTKLKLQQKLILNRWMLSLFEVRDFNHLSEGLKAPELEGFDENNVSKLYHEIATRLIERSQLTKEQLLRYDENIVRYWKKITEKRNKVYGHTLQPKYFQYLSLLFTEIYLDRYFTDPEKMLVDLNSHVERFNTGELDSPSHVGLFNAIPEAQQLKPFELDDLNKLAFWMATGSGKTLLMHINILQYRHYLDKHGRTKELNRTILLTPSEGLSIQHLEEFKLSGIPADHFKKDGSTLYAGGNVEIIEITKLKEESGDKTVAVEAFEGNNLVMVDEGHRGTSGKETGQWLQRRNQLCEEGFSFEYSATFGQAVKASGSKVLDRIYSKCILFDYSYRYFYKDGYGKDYRILNLAEDKDEEIRRKYFAACLLAFYQQLKLFKDKEPSLKQFLLEKPLWIFVGGSVTKTTSKKDLTDIEDIIVLLNNFISNRDITIDYLEGFLKGESGLLDDKERDIFSASYKYLSKLNLSAEEVYDDILNLLFNASTRGSLHIENLKGSDGEISLKIADNEPFGVINVGDSAKLCKILDEHDELVVADREFSDSLFHNLKDSDSTVNILIGSKKFMEGWNSWRVSTMGLMNVGKNEGSQIIQLFGRGVRLKGKDFSLKRSRTLTGIKKPDNIDLIETLNVFGIRADYMKQFKEYLEDEGLPSNEYRIEFVLPVLKDLPKKKLKTIKLKEGIDFKRNGPKPSLGLPPEDRKGIWIELDMYPKVQAMASEYGSPPTDYAFKQSGNLTDKHIAFMDIDEIYFELQQFKNEKSWFNLNISKNIITKLLESHDWYNLLIPPEELSEIRSFEQIQRWQDIAVALLKKHIEKLYLYHKGDFEKDHLEYRDLTEDDDNFIDDYLFFIEESISELVEKLEDLKSQIEKGKFKQLEYRGLDIFQINPHLYQPLVYAGNAMVEVKPVALNEGERDFVKDLHDFCIKYKDEFKEKELYLLRNKSKKGIGFFEAGNFYPDFIMWILDGKKQFISFVDPKGIRNVSGLDDPKIKFHESIKEIEDKLGDHDTHLNSFIISTTPFQDLLWPSKDMTIAKLEKHNVLFQSDDKDNYIGKLIKRSTQS